MMVIMLVSCICFGQNTSMSTIAIEKKGTSSMRGGVKIGRLHRKAEGELVREESLGSRKGLKILSRQRTYLRALRLGVE